MVGAIAVAALAAGIGSAASAQVKNWNTTSGTWSVGANWFNVGVPTPADQVQIGNLAIAKKGDRRAQHQHGDRIA